jgi:hypothetical protein
MNGIEPQFGETFLDKEDKIWLLTSDNIVNFDPQKLIRQIAAPNMIVQNFAVSKDNIKWESVAGFVNTKYSYKYKNFKFSVIGLSYSATENVRYHYRLLGFQNEFSEPTKQREVTFNNLNPGDYVFEIYADAGTDETKSEVRTFAFSIKPAFWQTTWFITICIAYLMLASAGLALYVQRRKNRALLERLETERELNDLRLRSVRLRAIPHFNFNVMGAIEYYFINRPKKDAMRLLNIYSNFTYETLRRVENASNTLGEELEYIRMYLELEKIRYVDKFDFRIDVPDDVELDVRLPNMLLHTYCENAIKHGLSPKMNNGGNLLLINIVQSNGKVNVCVEDNGVGGSTRRSTPISAAPNTD